ncbi:MAG: BrnT family toxin [Magnetococcales bacterium]|nr:BrnT family toxin [Magnetococcales bacterium]
MEITYDPAKRDKTLNERGLDFEDAVEVFFGPEFTFPDSRKEYGEPRFTTVGYFNSRMTVVVWTPRDGGRRIISMRYANDREISRYRNQLG